MASKKDDVKKVIETEIAAVTKQMNKANADGARLYNAIEKHHKEIDKHNAALDKLGAQLQANEQLLDSLDVKQGQLVRKLESAGRKLFGLW